MKTTSYEISKKLAEIGFPAAANFMRKPEGNLIATQQPIVGMIASFSKPTKEGCDYLGYSFASYDLETILEALPNFIENGNGTENCLVVDVAFGEIHYEGDCENDALFITTTRNNESLADTAARLLILLHKKGLINFNEGK